MTAGGGGCIRGRVAPARYDTGGGQDRGGQDGNEEDQGEEDHSEKDHDRHPGAKPRWSCPHHAATCPRPHPR